MRKRDFNIELEFFLNKIKNGNHFSLSRWGDGELMILEGKYIDLRNSKNGEFRYDPNIKSYDFVRSKLIESFRYKDTGYYVGIACPCCVGDQKYLYMKLKSEQNEENLTWANIFVNSNYNRFINEYVEEFKNHDIIMVVNKKANISKLPFNVEKVYYVGTDAWYEDLYLVEKIKEDIAKNNLVNKIFLFAAGALANIMSAELWEYRKNNTYIDIGSTLDVQMGMKPTRGYHMGANTLKKKCVW